VIDVSRSKLIAWAEYKTRNMFWISLIEYEPYDEFNAEAYEISKCWREHRSEILTNSLRSIYPHDDAEMNRIFKLLHSNNNLSRHVIPTQENSMIRMIRSIITWIPLAEVYSDFLQGNALSREREIKLTTAIIVCFIQQIRRAAAEGNPYLREVWERFAIEELTTASDIKHSSTRSETKPSKTKDAAKWIGLAAASGIIGAMAARKWDQSTKSIHKHFWRLKHRRPRHYDIHSSAEAIAAAYSALAASKLGTTSIDRLSCISVEELSNGSYRVTLSSGRAWATVELRSKYPDDAKVEYVGLSESDNLRLVSV